jgi:hypothetical protein
LLVPTLLMTRFDTPIRDLQVSYPKGQSQPYPGGEGEIKVYRGKLRLTVTWRSPESHPVPGLVDLSLRFQPCDGGTCLPPQKKSWRIRLSP